MIGQTIAHYRVSEKLGEGGMGVVYRATDTKLGRDVALKVLPEIFAADAERMGRFEREAQVLAALNHVNIAGIYGLEESAGVRALAMELVEGATLAERIAQGPIPLEEALVIAGQIADALEVAHEKGIVHRDLKPANIKVSPEGVVKVLDFGLAKAMEDDAAQGDASKSPTLTMAATKAGIILGTAAYMSPEQARGHAADRRADIWSFGVVLYEMLTGKHCFEGETVSDTLAAVLRADIALDALPASTPPPIRKLLRRCLERDRKRRLRDIGEARIAIEEYLASPADASVLMSAMAAPAPPVWRRALPWALAGAMTLTFAVTLVVLLRTPPPPVPEVARFEIDLGSLSFSGTRSGSRVTVSPDGRKIVMAATRTGSQGTQLFLRSMDNLEILPLPGTEGAAQPFFSTDSEWVGFSADNKLKKVSLAGGVPVTLCDAAGGSGVAATWADNGTILFLDNSGKLNRIPDGGGTPEKIAEADRNKGERFRWLQSLPGGRGVLVVAAGQNQFNIDVVTLETGKRERVVEGGSWPRYLPTGHILYAQYSSGGESAGFTGGLLVVPFDLKKLARAGSPIPVLEGVHTGSGGAGFYDVTADGTLVYNPGTASTVIKNLAWVDRKGKTEPLPAPPRDYRSLSLSPDATRVAMAVAGTSDDIHVYDLRRGTLQRLTFDGRNGTPMFTPDGSRIVYASSGTGNSPPNVWWKPADGSGAPERLATADSLQFPNSVSPDGKLLAFTQSSSGTRSDLFVMPLGGDRKPQVFLQTPFSETLAMFSPDGKWIAYMSDETGRYEIYVQAYPGPGGKQPISTGGGVTPLWSRDGKQLYYLSADKIMAVDVTTHPTFRAGTPRVVAEGLRINERGSRNFDIAADGRIIVAQRPEQAQEERSQLRVVQNFSTDVRQRLPAAKP